MKTSVLIKYYAECLDYLELLSSAMCIEPSASPCLVFDKDKEMLRVVRISIANEMVDNNSATLISNDCNKIECLIKEEILNLVK